MANRYWQGGQVRLDAVFTDPLNSDAPIDPTDVYCSVRDPNGVPKVYRYNVDAELGRTAVGVYYLDLDLPKAGRWYYYWYSTGVAKSAEEEWFEAERPHAI